MEGNISDTKQCASKHPSELEEKFFDDVVHVSKLIFC
jgi:hypothetical protein